MEEAGQALLWLTGDENGTHLRGRNSSREAYEEVGAHACHAPILVMHPSLPCAYTHDALFLRSLLTYAGRGHH